MAQKHKLTIDIFGTQPYDTDSIPSSMIELLKSNTNFTATIPDHDNVFLIGEINGKKIAVICGKEATYDDFTRRVDKALADACDLIFASTPHHADKYNYLKREVTVQGHYLVETSPLFLKIASGYPADETLQKILNDTYVEMLFNIINL